MTYSYLDEMAGILASDEPTGLEDTLVVHHVRKMPGDVQLVLGRFWFDPSQIPAEDARVASTVVGQGIVHNAYSFTTVCSAKPVRRKGVGVRVDAVMALDPPAVRLAHVIQTRSVRTKVGESIIGGRYKAQPLDPNGSVDMSAREEIVVARQHIAPVTHDWLAEKFEWYRTYCTLVAESQTSAWSARPSS